MLSNVTTFSLWSFCRTWLVPICIATAMVAVMFSSALAVVPALEDAIARSGGEAGHPVELGGIVMRTLSIAAILMLLHTIYLSLMAFHLVYRFPIEKQRWIGLVYVFIVLAYVAHAVHAADTMHTGGLLAAAWLSSLGFALVYLFMLLHGRHHAEDRRPTQLQRANWMWETDLAMLVVSALMFVRDTHVWDWSTLLAPVVATVLPDWDLLRTVHQQSSPKDGIVVLALLGFVGTQLRSLVLLRKGQPTLSDKVQGIQHFDFDEKHLMKIRSALPVNAAWLDIGSGHGTQLQELLKVMYDTEITRLNTIAAAPAQPNVPAQPIVTPFPQSVALLDRDETALTKAKASWPAWWPATSRPEYAHCDMTDPGAVSLLKQCTVAHMSHVAYQPKTVHAALQLLKAAARDTYLLLRFTSDRSFYRVISTSTACAPFRPYIHHHMHTLLISDLERHGWTRADGVVLPRTCDISVERHVTDTVDWCDAQYGEFSGDIIERYFAGLRRAGETGVANWDSLVLLRKTS